MDLAYLIGLSIAFITKVWVAIIILKYFNLI